jgi:hypothetical protein
METIEIREEELEFFQCMASDTGLELYEVVRRFVKGGKSEVYGYEEVLEDIQE